VIHLTHGDLLKQDADALVNTVNCVGVMGRGVALQFRRAFEDNYEAYRKAAIRKEIQLGRMFVFERASLEPLAGSSTSPPNAIGRAKAE
jgi:O-acetyl-ADP-ribose deacetylase (regulator of RNase III)